MIWVVALMMILAASCVEGAVNWSHRVIPLPKEMKVNGSVKITSGRIAIDPPAEETPEIRTAVRMLQQFAKGTPGSADFRIRLVMSRDKPGDPVVNRLSTLPNSDQAYAIVPEKNKGLTLIANTPIGLLYACRTLGQMVGEQEVSQYAEVEIPLVRITDWPDMVERGQWGGDTASHLASTSSYKLNVLEENAQLEVNADGSVSTKINRKLFDEGSELGVKIVPFIMHLEQIYKYAGLKNVPGVASTPDPSKPLPSDYIPGLCMSSPATRELVRTWIKKIAEVPQVTDIMVWLSEDRAPCFCEKCRDKEPFELEVDCINSSFRTVQSSYPRIRLRILTTQGSYPVNDKVLKVAPKDVGVSYYDGGRTYDSSRNPMIYPLLEEFAKSGRWLGVYPQITHSWRCVFPWSGPQFVNFRAKEFADKKLSCMIGYAVPGNKYHEFNVAAMAEWTWNSKGRSPEDFCRAWAVKTGVCDPDTFVKWVMLAGDAGWSLAESKLFLTAIYNPSIGVGSSVAFDHRFEKAGISAPGNLDAAVSKAKESLKIAVKTGNADMISESQCVLAGLEAFAAIRTAHPLLSSPEIDDNGRKSLSESLDKLDECSQMLRSELINWGNRIANSRPLPGRLFDTAFALLKTCDIYREKASSLGVIDPRPELRPRKIIEWSAADFADSPTAVIRTDISDVVPVDGGSYQAVFDFIESAYGTEVKKASVIVIDRQDEKTVAVTTDVPVRVSKWERCHEARLIIPKRDPGTKLFLEITVSGLPSDAPPARRTCSGSVSLRKVEEYAAVGRNYWQDTHERL